MKRFAWAGALLFALTVPPMRASAQTPADIEGGKQLFNGMCVECHGAGGAGGDAPSLNRARLMHAPTDAALISILTNGIPNTAMPRIRRFTDNEMSQLVDVRAVAWQTCRGESARRRQEGRRRLQEPRLRGLPHRQRRGRQPRTRPV